MLFCSPNIYLVDMTTVTRPKVVTRMFPGSNEPTVLDPHISLTDTKMIEVHGTKITLREFWYYQVSSMSSFQGHDSL